MSDLRACVIGWPVAHSRSPLIHRHWLRHYGIAGDYELAPVPPDAAASFFRDFAAGPYVGGNVTVPYKEAAFAAVGEADDTARALGVVNTLWLEGGRLHGAATDPLGFLANLDQQVPGWERAGDPALVIGAGGAARAIVWALAERGIGRIFVANRTLARAEAIAARFPAALAVPWPDLPRRLAESRLLVNTTSLGMQGQPPLALDLSPLPDDALVHDIVYAPLVTGLLAEAAARGLRTVDGLGMLLHQAAPGFARWFGVLPEVTPELRRAVLADLEVA